LKENLRWSPRAQSAEGKSEIGYSLRRSIQAPDIQQIDIDNSGTELRVKGALNGWDGQGSATTFVLDTGGIYEIILPRGQAGSEIVYLPEVEPVSSQSAAGIQQSALGFVAGITVEGIRWDRLVARLPASDTSITQAHLGLLPLSACAAVKLDVAREFLALAAKSPEALFTETSNAWCSIPWKGFGAWKWEDPQVRGFYNPACGAQQEDPNQFEMPHIEVLVDGRPMRAVIDSGCDVGICFFEDRPLADSRQRTVATTGKDASVQYGRFTGELKIGEITATNLSAYVIEPQPGNGTRPYDILLGIEFLNQVVVIFDFEHQQIHLRPN
jgi:hypothetical protein